MLQRPPVDWSASPPRSASYIFPYVVAWSQQTEKVHVFSLLDQKCIQELPFQVWQNETTLTQSITMTCTLCLVEWSFSGRLFWSFVWCSGTVHLLLPSSATQGAGKGSSLLDFMRDFSCVLGESSARETVGRGGSSIG